MGAKTNHTGFFLPKFSVKKVVKFFVMINVTTQIIPIHATCTMVPKCGNPIIIWLKHHHRVFHSTWVLTNISPTTSPIAYCTRVPPKTPPTPSINSPHNTHKGVPVSRFVPFVQTHILSFQRALLPTKENLEYDNEKKYQQYMPLNLWLELLKERI